MAAAAAARAADNGDAIDALYSSAIVADTLCLINWDQNDQDAWRRSGYTAVHTSLENRNFDVARRELEIWNDRFAQNRDTLIRCERAADILRAKREGKLAVMLGFQNATAIDDSIDNLDTLRAAGARAIQITYNSRNLLGDGCTERTNAGLSDFGVAAVARMSELGILVDLSHCGQQTSADGIAFSKRPPAFTHTACRALFDHPRAKSDELLRAMSDKGGFTGIVALGYLVGPAGTSMEQYLRHIDHAVNVCGIDHVGLASDFAIQGLQATATRRNWYEPRLRAFKPEYQVRWPPWIVELDQPERYRTVAHRLSLRGYSAAQIEKLLGRNWVRLLEDSAG